MDHAFDLPASLTKKYDVLERLYEDRLGTVYKVRHRIFGYVRVAKVTRAFHLDDENLQLRYRRAARIALRMRHPNIARFFDFMITGGVACIVREYIDGRTFRRILDADGPPEFDLALELAQQSLLALQHIHERGYVHRHISPDGLMMTWDVDGRPQVKLIELGLAKRFAGGEDLTATGAFTGLGRYSAPEQFHESPPDPRTDIYSFGVVLYEMLTGIHPIEGETFADHFRGHLLRPPRDFVETDARGRIPLGLRAVILRSLEKNPEHRMSTASEFARRLEPFRESSRKIQA